MRRKRSATFCTEKNLSVAFCHRFNVKHPSRPDKTTTTATWANLTVISCFYFIVFLLVLWGQLLSGFLTTKMLFIRGFYSQSDSALGPDLQYVLIYWQHLSWYLPFFHSVKINNFHPLQLRLCMTSASSGEKMQVFTHPQTSCLVP